MKRVYDITNFPYKLEGFNIKAMMFLQEKRDKTTSEWLKDKDRLAILGNL